MLTEKQLNWIKHLSDDDKIVIKPCDPKAIKKFNIVKKKIQKFLGKKIPIVHRGASNLGISGQDEIDIYIPVSKNKFNKTLNQLKKFFGLPASLYALERARFVTSQGSKYTTVSLMNNSHSGWINGEKFEKYLRSHPTSLEAYRLLKEKGNGLSVREYYRRKLEFINEILTKENI